MGGPVTTFWLHLWSSISKQTMLNGYWMPGSRKSNLVINSGQHFVGSMDTTIYSKVTQWINHCLVDSMVCFVNTYPVESIIQPLNNWDQLYRWEPVILLLREKPVIDFMWNIIQYFSSYEKFFILKISNVLICFVVAHCMWYGQAYDALKKLWKTMFFSYILRRFVNFFYQCWS